MNTQKLFLTLGIALTSLSAWAGKIVTDSIKSNVLGASVSYNVYLPDGFAGHTARYPVVYLLHGLTDTYTAWQDKGCMKEIADELIASGEAVPMVIVMPNAGGPDTRNQWNGYFDMPGWSYERFFFSEFMPTVEQKYSIQSDKAHRAIMGLSMGGGGSTVYCQRHPDMFSSCYAMSAWLSNDEPKEAQHGKDKLYWVQKSVHDHSAIDFMAQADDATKDKLRTVRWFFDCGDDDFLVTLSFKIHEQFRKAGIKDELRIRNGVHNWEYWRHSLRAALPFASQSFRR